MKITKTLKPIAPTLMEEMEAHFEVKYPEDYKEFIKKNNGALIESKTALFIIPRIWVTKDGQNENFEDGLEMLFGFNYPDNVEESEIKDFYQTNLTYREEGFLPENVVGIGHCMSGSLICLSLNKEDFGAVYYWDYYWQYPFAGDFYNNRFEDLDKKFGIKKAKFEEASQAEKEEMFNAYNYATLIKLANSFTEFSTILKEK